MKDANELSEIVTRSHKYELYTAQRLTDVRKAALS